MNVHRQLHTARATREIQVEGLKAARQSEGAALIFAQLLPKLPRNASSFPAGIRIALVRDSPLTCGQSLSEEPGRRVFEVK